MLPWQDYTPLENAKKHPPFTGVCLLRTFTHREYWKKSKCLCCSFSLFSPLSPAHRLTALIIKMKGIWGPTDQFCPGASSQVNPALPRGWSPFGGVSLFRIICVHSHTKSNNKTARIKNCASTKAQKKIMTQQQPNSRENKGFRGIHVKQTNKQKRFTGLLINVTCQTNHVPDKWIDTTC